MFKDQKDVTNVCILSHVLIKNVGALQPTEPKKMLLFQMVTGFPGLILNKKEDDDESIFKKSHVVSQSG